MAASSGTEALNVVIERLSEICHKTDQLQASVSVDNRSVGSQTPAITVLPAGSPPQRSVVTLQNTSPSKKEVFNCEECEYSSHNKHYLKQHADLVHRADRPFKCPFCDYAGKRSYALKEHLIVHSNDRPFECSHCNATFRKKGHLTNHIKMHASQWSVIFKCNICKLIFSSRDALYEHVGKHANEDGDVFACEFCLFATMDKDSIVRHIDSGSCTEKQTYQCNTCEYTASNEDDLAAHKAMHFIQKLPPVAKHASQPTQVSLILKCSECGFTSREQDILESHILNQHINASATTKAPPPNHKPNLLKKVRAQPKESGQKHVCHLCGIGYNDPQLLPQHMTTHLTKSATTKPPQLPNQSKNTCLNPETARFSYDPSLRIFRCSICGYTCEHQRTIKSHIWKHSGHKDVGYPMFQNGPLSIYDEGGNKTQEFQNVTIMSSHQPTQVPVTMVQRDPTPMTTVSKPVAVPDLSTVVTLREKPQPANKIVLQPNIKPTSQPAVAPTASSILFPQSVPQPPPLLARDSDVQTVEECQVIVTQGSDITEEVIASVAEVVVGDDEESQVLILSVDDEMGEDESVGSDEPEEVVERPGKRKQEDLNTEEEIAQKKVCIEEPESPVLESSEDKTSIKAEVLVVEDVAVADVKDSTSVPDLPPKDSPRVPDVASETSSVATEAAGQVPVSVVTVEVPSGMKSESPAPSSAEDELTKSLIAVCENVETVNTKRSGRKGQVKFSGMDNLDGTQRAKTAEPKSPHRKYGHHRSSSHRKNKSGISSSLLAVIEQLRERSKSDSEHEDSSDTVKVQPVLKVTKRSRSKRSSVDDLPDIEAYQHVEKLEHEAGMYRCKLCHYKSASTNLMKQHMRLHKSKKPFECSLCDFIADTSETLQDHMLQHCKIRTYQCKLCPSTFNYKSQLRAHMRAHNETEPFTCDVCEFETFNPILFRNHAKMHKKDFHCQECEDVFTERCETENHTRIEVRAGGNLYCDECGLILLSHSDLRKHQKSHIKQLHCEQCNFSCSTLGRMRNHCRLHLDEKPMKCSLCDFTAISTRSLKSHMKRHINDQRYVQQPLEQYKCNLCGYVCHHLPSLKSHMWRHASETGYSYQDANDAINAAIDYENNIRPQVKTPELPDSVEGTDENSETDPENVKVFDDVRELLNEKKVIKVNKEGNTLVTFRCCQCGFESVSRVSLTAHMKHHTDIITKTLEISQTTKKAAPVEVSSDEQGDE